MDINTLEIYKAIKQIAKVLRDKKETFTRTELAFNLREHGILNDSIYVSKLTFDAYNHFTDPLIKESFYSNDRATLLVTEYELIDSLDRGDHKSAILGIEKQTKCGKVSILALEQSMTKIEDNNIRSNSNLLNTAMGAGRIDQIKERANIDFENYTNLIFCYQDAKSNVKSCVSDFVFFREQILDTYCHYTDLLLDIYGDSIRVVDPKLFDFDSIEWLDTDSMFQQVELQFNSLHSSCQTLMGEISENFKNTLNQAAQSYKAAGNKRLGLVMAGIHVFDHYISAQQRTQTIEREFISLQTNIKRDVNTIKADYIRLYTIYKTLNELQIPKAKHLYSYINAAMSNELSILIDSMYKTDELKELKSQRDSINLEYRSIKKLIIDNQANTQYYNSSIAEIKESLSQIKPLYLEANSAKPSKPFFLFNILCFGLLNKSYCRSIWEWEDKFGSIVNGYLSLQNNFTLYQQEVAELQSALKSYRIKYEQLKVDLNVLKTKVFALLKNSDNLKRQVAVHLKTIIQVLNIAKEIIATKLDEKQIKVTVLNKKNTELSKNQEHAIEEFMSQLKSYGNEQQDISSTNNELLQHTDSVKMKLEELIEDKLRLEALRRNNNIAIQDYDRQLELLKQNFSEYLTNVDDKSEVLRLALAKLHKTTDLEALKEALLSFSEHDVILSDSDFEEFISGNKIIEI